MLKSHLKYQNKKPQKNYTFFSHLHNHTINITFVN